MSDVVARLSQTATPDELRTLAVRVQITTGVDLRQTNDATGHDQDEIRRVCDALCSMGFEVR